MRQVSGSALHSAAGGLHVHPEEISQKRFLEVAVDVGMVDDPQQLVDGQDRLTHGLDEPILTLHGQSDHPSNTVNHFHRSFHFIDLFRMTQ